LRCAPFSSNTSPQGGRLLSRLLLLLLLLRLILLRMLVLLLLLPQQVKPVGRSTTPRTLLAPVTAHINLLPARCAPGPASALRALHPLLAVVEVIVVSIRKLNMFNRQFHSLKVSEYVIHLLFATFWMSQVICKYANWTYKQGLKWATQTSKMVGVKKVEKLFYLAHSTIFL